MGMNGIKMGCDEGWREGGNELDVFWVGYMGAWCPSLLVDAGAVVGIG